ncbi:reverse transcriptase domain-containing protein [Tanacetum coccineum]
MKRSITGVVMKKQWYEWLEEEFEKARLDKGNFMKQSRNGDEENNIGGGAQPPCTNTTNGYQSTMSNRHKDWLVQEQTALELTSPEQTATVKMVFSRPWTCTFLVAKGLATPELMANCCCKDQKEMICKTLTAQEEFEEFCLLLSLEAQIEGTLEENLSSQSGDKLDDALWAFHTVFKTPISCTPYKLMYGKSCHLPIELEHKAYWTLKHSNFDLKTAGDHRKLQLNELRDQAYKNSLIYKERTKKLHHSKIKNRIFNVGDRVLLFNYRLKIFSGKLKTRWLGPFTITQVFPYGTVELSQSDGPNFKVNGHRVKHYFIGDIPSNVVPDLQTIPMDN